jgi:hypothetical protein
MLASYPASILNHIPPPSGIPFDSLKTGNALELQCDSRHLGLPGNVRFENAVETALI